MTASDQKEEEAKAAEIIPPPLSLHDALALGEVEVGLLAENREKSELEEIERLPVLLRLLSSSRPLASIPTFDNPKQKKEEEEEEAEPAAVPVDEIANQVVARLEDVAATHSIAEGVDVVACHLAPTICRNLSKLSPLKRKRSSISGATTSTPGKSSLPCQTPGWDTSELVVVGSNPRSSFKRRRMSSKMAIGTTGKEDADDIAAGFSEGVISSDEEGTKGGADNSSSRASLSRRTSMELKEAGAAEDSQEELVAKTLSELSGLVASALEPFKVVDGEGEHRNGKLALASEDSIFSEPVRSHTSSEGTRGVMTGSDLGSTVASLMHHSPVLRHQHVANALCRATVPQAAGLIKKMGANCPSATAALLRGCIDAYKTATVVGSRHSSSVANMATSAINALAELSVREKSRVRTTLQQDGILVDLQLNLTLRSSQDPKMDAVYFLLERLTKEEEYAVLQDKAALLEASLALLRDELSSSLESSDLQCEFGRICLLLRCYAWLVLRCDMTPTFLTSETMTSHLAVVQEALTKIREQAGANWAEQSLVLLFCGLVFTLGRLLGLEKSEAAAALDLCGSVVKECLDCRSKNTEYEILMARFILAFQQGDTTGFRALLESVLAVELCSGSGYIPQTENLEVFVAKVGDWLRDGACDVDAVLKDGLATSSPSHLSFLLSALESSGSTAMDMKDVIEKCLTGLLTETSEAASLVDHSNAADFIVKSTKYLAAVRDINLPLLSPFQLESSVGKVARTDWISPNSKVDNRLLYQVLYWFAFIDTGPKSLFAYDARGLPLKEILSVSRMKSSESVGSKQLDFYLFNLINKHFPEVPMQHKRWELARRSTIDSANIPKQDKASLRRALSKALRSAASSDSADPTGAMAERKFMCAQRDLSDSVLHTELASALLSTPNSPLPFITYSVLCSDPLVLLKVPMRVWQCQGLRRIMLTALTSMLETNAAVLYRTSPSITGANELVSCRNLLLVRCILVAVSGRDDNNSSNSKLDRAPFVCSMTTNFLRMLVAKNPGLVGTVVKQSPAIADCAMDWLIEFVPETMDDSSSLVNVLSGSASVTSRLTASASILRIAIAHGHRDEAATERLVYTALAQLVSSFFLVIGPVGVPVNVLIGEGTGQDVTQTSRKATFRMLRSLVNVRGRMRPRMRSECGLALHKLAGLCKGENLLSGVTGAVLARRKGLLREMFEAVTKAANAMGSGMEL